MNKKGINIKLKPYASNEYIDYNLPLKEIDFPNDTKKKEIPIKFVGD